VAPKIDGVVDPGEWGFASSGGGNWGMLRLPDTALDQEKSRFRVMWDNSFVYFLIQSDKTTWSPASGNSTPFVPGQQVQGISFGDDNINLYLDPNTDGESNFRPNNEVDGYQIAWNQREGTGSLGDDGNGAQVFNNTGLFLETHINDPFGNQGQWQGLRKSSFVQNHGSTGGVIEFALAWADIDAPSAAQFPVLPADTGTAHPRPAANGERWIFNLARISTDPNNFLPIWSWHPAQSFAVAPHGTLEFIDGPGNPVINSITYTGFGFLVKFRSSQGSKYDLEYSESLGDDANWITVVADLEGTGGEVGYEDQDFDRVVFNAKGFYRVVLK
jgi:hypothetical protein